MAQMAELSAKIKEDDAKLAVLDAEIADLLARIPNLPDASVPVGANSARQRRGAPLGAAAQLLL